MHGVSPVSQLQVNWAVAGSESGVLAGAGECRMSLNLEQVPRC